MNQNRKMRARITCNVGDTQYEVVKKVASSLMNWDLNTIFLSETWDICWTDNAVSPEQLTKMQAFQKINHFPGMHGICKKNYLAWNLNRMAKVFPLDFNFHPKTWVLPGDFIEFKNSFVKGMTYILKPEALSQGKGIFLVRRLEDVQNDERLVVQEYLKNPLLIDGVKFDMRIYVLVTGCSPLRIFIHEMGIARLATENFCSPKPANLKALCMHLTNYAVNKNSSKFVFNTDAEQDDVGHKRSLNAVYEYLENNGFDVQGLKEEIERVIIKTLCAVQPYLSHLYKACQPEELSNSMCFELLGFDIILDSSLKPWVLEVNHSPSFSTDSPLDWKIKEKVINDTLLLLNVTSRNRKKFFSEMKNKVRNRAFTGKIDRMTKENRSKLVEEKQKERDLWEEKHLGGFKKIYGGTEGDFQQFQQAAQDFYEGFTGVNTSRVKKKESKKDPVNFRASSKTKGLEDLNLTQNSRFLNFVERNEKKFRLDQSFDSPCKRTEFSSRLRGKSLEIPPLHVESLKLKNLPIKFDEPPVLHGNFLMPKSYEFSGKRYPAQVFKSLM